MPVAANDLLSTTADGSITLPCEGMRVQLSPPKRRFYGLVYHNSDLKITILCLRGGILPVRKRAAKVVGKNAGIHKRTHLLDLRGTHEADGDAHCNSQPEGPSSSLQRPVQSSLSFRTIDRVTYLICV